MEYTVSKEGDKKVEKDMSIIVNELKKIPKVISIILTGGFGRGEGPIKKIKNKIALYNDYDVQVVSEIAMDKEKVDRLSEEISKKLGFSGIINFYPFVKERQKIKDNFYLDLKFYTLKELKELLPRIRTYEFRNDSTILYGKDIRKLIPNYSLKKISLSEGIKFVLDRMSHLIEYYSLEKNHDEEFVAYSICQAYSAMCTALLLLSKKYEIGYKKSSDIFFNNYKKDFPELNKKIPSLGKKIKEYAKWRLDAEKKKIKNIDEEWRNVGRNIIEVAKYILSKFLNKNICTLDELSDSIFEMKEKFYSPYVKEILKNKIGFENKLLVKFLTPFVSLVLKYKFYQRLKKRKMQSLKIFFSRSPDMTIYASAPYILGAILEENKIDKQILKKGQEIFKRIYPTNSLEWESVSVEYANAYIAFFLQKI